MEKKVTQVTSCYLCSEWLDTAQFNDHFTQCAQVLEKCPSVNGKCKAYLPRRYVAEHMKEFHNPAAAVRGNQQAQYAEQRYCEIEERMNALELDNQLLRKALNEEIRQRLHLITNIGALNKRRVIADEWTRKVSDVLGSLKKCLNDETEARSLDMRQCRNDIKILIQQLNLPSTTATNRLSQPNDGGAITKIAQFDYELKSLKHIVHESEDNLDKVGKQCDKMETMCRQTNQNVENIETHLLHQDCVTTIESTRGHLLWRVTDYAQKLQDAREHATTLRSPIFCNRKYGYMLRLDVNLNGIGTWRGRNLIANLTIMPGQYDALLDWPCKIEAQITLRDQSRHSDTATEIKDYSRIVIGKRKNENADLDGTMGASNMYIHIPHKIIEGGGFIKNNSIFLEVKVQKL